MKDETSAKLKFASENRALNEHNASLEEQLEEEEERRLAVEKQLTTAQITVSIVIILCLSSRRWMKG